jgi:hypothetical protein
VRVISAPSSGEPSRRPRLGALFGHRNGHHLWGHIDGLGHGRHQLRDAGARVLDRGADAFVVRRIRALDEHDDGVGTQGFAVDVFATGRGNDGFQQPGDGGWISRQRLPGQEVQRTSAGVGEAKRGRGGFLGVETDVGFEKEAGGGLAVTLAGGEAGRKGEVEHIRVGAEVHEAGVADGIAAGGSGEREKQNPEDEDNEGAEVRASVLECGGMPPLS